MALSSRMRRLRKRQNLVTWQIKSCKHYMKHICQADFYPSRRTTERRQCFFPHLVIGLYVTMAIFQSHYSHRAQCVHSLSLQADPEVFLMFLCFFFVPPQDQRPEKQIVSGEIGTLNYNFIFFFFFRANSRGAALEKPPLPNICNYALIFFFFSKSD